MNVKFIIEFFDIKEQVGTSSITIEGISTSAEAEKIVKEKLKKNIVFEKEYMEYIQAEDEWDVCMRGYIEDMKNFAIYNMTIDNKYSYKLTELNQEDNLELIITQELKDGFNYKIIETIEQS